MKYSAVIVAALAAVASAQDISIFPSCSLPCILNAISTATNCQATDYPCVCKNMDALTAAATSCVVQACGIDVATGMLSSPCDRPIYLECGPLTVPVGTVLPATKQFCASVDTSGGSSSSSSAAAVTSSTTQSATEVSTSTSIQSSTSTSVQVSTTTSATTSTAAAVTTTTKASNGTATKTASSTPSSVVTAGAAVMGSIGSAAMLLLGAAAFAL